MACRYYQENSEPTEQKRLVDLVPLFVNPLEKADDEHRSSYDSNQAKVEYGQVDIAVEAVIKRWEGTSRYKYIDACVIQPTEYLVDLYIILVITS